MEHGLPTTPPSPTIPTTFRARVRVRATGNGPAKGMPVLSECKRAQPKAARNTAKINAKQAWQGGQQPQGGTHVYAYEHLTTFNM
eukprot:363759-Chlamydomonas_euryale.AAC.30